MFPNSPPALTPGASRGRVGHRMAFVSAILGLSSQSSVTSTFTTKILMKATLKRMCLHIKINLINLIKIPSQN